VTNRADAFPPLPDHRRQRWATFGRWERPYFPSLLGIEVMDLRDGYCQMRLPWRGELTQPAGVVHGGVIASLLDTVVVPAIGAGYDDAMQFATVDLHVQYHGAVVRDDMIAEGWVTRRGRSVVFCEAEVRVEPGHVVAKGIMTYRVSPPR
jgi:uncharacterized protein (TIGR00369 family)